MSVQVTRPTHLIDLAVGHPEPDLLPVDLLRPLAVKTENLTYGEQAGAASFRQQLANWLTEDYGQTISANELLVTNGSSNALDMICSQLISNSDANPTVLVEDPSYFIALKLFKARGFEVVALPMDDEGIELAALEQAIKDHRPAFIYTIPVFHNPTGITQSHQRRQELVQLAKQHNCPLIADEVYQSLYFADKPPAPLACYATDSLTSNDKSAPVISIGSFSKILAPGLRLGWIQGNGELFDPLRSSALLQSGGGLAPLTSALMGNLLASGDFQQNLAYLRQTYQARAEALYQSLISVFGDTIQIQQPEGGYFLWVSFKDGRDLTALRESAQKAGVNYLPGSLCSANGQFSNSMRLCFAWYGEEELKVACDRLGKALL